MAGVTAPEPSVLALISQSLTEVKDALNALSRDLHGTLSRLPTEYVPRREVERRFDELTIDLGAEQAAREAAVQALKDANDKAAAEHAVSRRWRIGLAVATAMSGTGVLSGIYLHFQ